MIVRDIIQDAKEVLNYCDNDTVYNRLTHAVEVLANRGNWEPMLGYLDITVSEGNVVTLPYQVETPIRVNINNSPSFSRSRLYEFTLNGPGNDMSETTGFSWMDRGLTPVFAQPSVPAKVKLHSPNSLDNGKQVMVYGIPTDTDTNSELGEALTLNEGTPPESFYTFSEITRIIKPVTVGNVLLKTSAGQLLSTYFAGETEPAYKQILLSKEAPAVRMLFRRSTLRISSEDDFIPLQSQMAILLMLKSLEKYRKGMTNEDFAIAKAYEEQAVKLAQEEQDSRAGFNLSQTTETQTPLDLNYNNRDSLIVADIYDDVAGLVGPVGRGKVFDHITEALEALNNKGQWDGMDGYIDITTDDDTVTLPRYVEVPISVNIGGRPATMRNKWFEFHLNGPGSCGSSCSWTWDDRGDVVTISDPCDPFQLIAIPALPIDNGKFIRVLGYDEDGKWIRSTNPDTDELDDGLWLEMDDALVAPETDATYFSRIERIIKDETSGFVTLQGFDESRNTITTLGYYYPDETEPTYRRIRLNGSCEWVRMRYRKRTLKVTSLTDQLHLKSKLAVMCMCRSLASLKAGEFAKAGEMEKKALQYIAEEQMSRNPAETFSFQFDQNIHMSSFEHGQY